MTPEELLRKQATEAITNFRRSLKNYQDLGQQLATFDADSIPDSDLASMAELITKVLDPIHSNVPFVVLAGAVLNRYCAEVA